MSTVTETVQKTGQNLESALNAIFLAIGNAYYDANKSFTNGNSSGKPSPSALGAECNMRIKASRAAFLDSLDQLDIMVIRATEVLQRCARQKEANLFDKTSDVLAIDALPDPVTATDETKEQGPSPETMLLSGEGLLPPSNEGVPIPLPDFSTEPLPDVTNEAIDPLVPLDQISTQVTDGQVDGTALPDSTGQQDDVALDADLVAAKPLDDEMMDFDGPIDFGDMVFDFNLDDTAHFDFGAMIDAD